MLLRSFDGNTVVHPRNITEGGEHMMTLTIIIASTSLAAMVAGYIAMVKV